jgi:muconolactone D-isomerase
MDANQRSTLAAAEIERGAELIAAGHILRIWRIPGRRANVAVYVADTATDLHSILTSLPYWPWMDMTVEPLALHPLEAGRDTVGGS